MRAALACARVEWVRFFRDRVAMFSTVALPVILVLLIGASVASGGDRVAVGVLPEQPGPLGDQFVADLEQSPALNTVTYTDERDMFRDIRMGVLGGGVRVRGDGEPVMLYLQQAGGDVGAVITTVNAAVDEIGTEAIATEVLAEQVGAPRAASAVRQAITDVPPVQVRTRTLGAAQPSVFASAVPSQLMLFTFLNGLLGAAALVAARQLGVFSRVLSAPRGLGVYVSGLGMSRFAIAMLQAVILLGLGAVAFGLSYGATAAVVVLVVVYGAVAAAAGMLLGAVSRSTAQATAVAVPLGIVMGMLGGCMWPLAVVPPLMQVIGHLTPQAWAMDAWDLLSEGAGLTGIAGQVAILAGFAAVLGGLAVLGLRRHAQTGR